MKTKAVIGSLAAGWLLAASLVSARVAEPKKGDARQVDFSGGATLEADT